MTMIAASTGHRLHLEAEAIDLDDWVRAPDGRVGRVIGFYRRDEVSVVVLFASGGTGQFPHAQLAPL
jgi:hypothetical protein